MNKLKAAILITLILSTAATTQAELTPEAPDISTKRSVSKTAAFYLAGQTLDYGLTEYGLSRGLREGNPLMQKRGVRSAVSLGIAGAFTWYDLQEKNKRRRRVVRVFYFISQATVVGWNVRQISKLKSSP